MDFRQNSWYYTKINTRKTKATGIDPNRLIMEHIKPAHLNQPTYPSLCARDENMIPIMLKNGAAKITTKLSNIQNAVKCISLAGMGDRKTNKIYAPGKVPSKKEIRALFFPDSLIFTMNHHF